MYSSSNAMKRYTLMLLLLASINLSAAEFVDPVLAINKVLDVAEDYISEDANIEREKYYLASIHFGYFLTEEGPREPKWIISYKVKSTDKSNNKLHSGFHISLSNELNPTIEITLGL